MPIIEGTENKGLDDEFHRVAAYAGTVVVFALLVHYHSNSR